LLPNSTQRAKGLIVWVSPDNQDILIQKPKMESAIGNTLIDLARQIYYHCEGGGASWMPVWNI
jgi:hypothetical protein